jgi:hypothetical protein
MQSARGDSLHGFVYPFPIRCIGCLSLSKDRMKAGAILGERLYFDLGTLLRQLGLS